VLNRFVNDSNEYIHDSFGRTGHLINIGDMYLFHPVEITNSHISLKERTTPLHYKNEKLIIKIQDMDEKDDVNKGLIENDYYTKRLIKLPSKTISEEKEKIDYERKEYEERPKEQKLQTIKETIKENEETKIVETTVKRKLFEKMYINYMDSVGPLDESLKKSKRDGWVVKRGEDNWFKVCNIVIRNNSENGTVDYDLAVSFLIAHIIEELTFEEHLILLDGFLTSDKNESYSNSLEELNLENGIKKYFSDKMIDKDGKAILLYNKARSVKKNPKLNYEYDTIMEELNQKGIFLYVLIGGIWKESGYSDYLKYDTQIKTWRDNILKKSLNTRIGYISSDVYIFKTKDMELSRNRGARCDQAQKTEIIKQLNSIIRSSDKSVFEPIADKTKKSRVELCIMQEFYLRLLQYEGVNNKTWFLTPIEVSLKDIE